MSFESKMYNELKNYKEHINNVRTDILKSEYILNLDVVLENKFKLKHIGTCSNLDLRTVSLFLFDKNNIKKVILELEKKNLGFQIKQDNVNIIISSPIMTEERRNQIISSLKNTTEDYKIRIRLIRQDTIKKKPELKKKVQEETDKSIKELDRLYLEKTTSIKG